MNVRKKRQIILPNNTFLLILLIAPYFKPAGLEYISLRLDKIFDIYKVFSFTLILGIYLYNRKYSKIILAITVYQFILLVSTVLHSGNYWKLAVSCGTVISFSMITEIVLIQNPKLFFKSVVYTYSFLIPLDFFLYLLYPNGFGQSDYYRGNIYYFLGLRNGFAPLFLPVIICFCIHSSYYKHRLTLIALFTIICGSLRLLMTWSATGVVSWFILMVYICFIYKSPIAKFFEIRKYYLAFIICQFGFVVFRLQVYFTYIIEILLKKSVTFTGRTEIWDSAFMLIKKSPLLGYGVYEGHGLIRRGNLFYYSHNAVLEILLQGGIVALIAFFILFLIPAVPLYKYRNHYLSGIISTGIFSLLVIMLAEAKIADIWLYMLLIIATCITHIIRQIDYETGQKQENHFLNLESKTDTEVF